MSGFDSTFRAAIPGISLTHKMGSLPHEKPPKYVKPDDALEYFWKQFHRKEVLKQIWALLEQGCTVWAITKAILFKACLEGIIAMNLSMVIYQHIGQMITVLGKSKGIDVKVNPKFRDKIKDDKLSINLNKKLGRAVPQKIPASALKSTMLPKADQITKAMNEFTGKQAPAAHNGLLNTVQKEQDNG